MLCPVAGPLTIIPSLLALPLIGYLSAFLLENRNNYLLWSRVGRPALVRTIPWCPYHVTIFALTRPALQSAITDRLAHVLQRRHRLLHCEAPIPKDTASALRNLGGVLLLVVPNRLHYCDPVRLPLLRSVQVLELPNPMVNVSTFQKLRDGQPSVRFTGCLRGAHLRASRSSTVRFLVAECPAHCGADHIHEFHVHRRRPYTPLHV